MALHIALLFKVGVKVFTKPILGMVARKAYSIKNPIIRDSLIKVGRAVKKGEIKMKRRLESNQETGEIVISDSEAFEKGNEFIIEFILLFGIMGGLAINEGKKQIKLNRERNQRILTL